jgi:hypothetical protein
MTGWPAGRDGIGHREGWPVDVPVLVHSRADDVDGGPAGCGHDLTATGSARILVVVPGSPLQVAGRPVRDGEDGGGVTRRARGVGRAHGVDRLAVRAEGLGRGEGGVLGVIA